jgi:hypothetical protein
METITFDKKKISLAQTILSLKDPNIMFQIEAFIKKITKETSTDNIEENEYDAKQLSFEEWNNQFEDDYKLDDYLPEYGMTVKEYRLEIYNSERGNGMSKEQFFEKIDNLK